MSDERDPVGSVADEAVKLFGALQDWARETGDDLDGALAGAASAFKTLNEHIATDGQNCKYCPICQFISVARERSPEVGQHLASAAASLLQALSAAHAPRPFSRTSDSSGRPVEKINLSDETWDQDG